jgi:hypothetical protein
MFSKFHLNTSKYPNIKVVYFSRDTTLILSGIAGLKCKMVKMQVNAHSYYSLAPRKQQTWLAVCAKLVDKKSIRPF